MFVWGATSETSNIGKEPDYNCSMDQKPDFVLLKGIAIEKARARTIPDEIIIGYTYKIEVYDLRDS